jgi:hypothetical protein
VLPCVLLLLLSLAARADFGGYEPALPAPGQASADQWATPAAPEGFGAATGFEAATGAHTKRCSRGCARDALRHGLPALVHDGVSQLKQPR